MDERQSKNQEEIVYTDEHPHGIGDRRVAHIYGIPLQTIIAFITPLVVVASMWGSLNRGLAAEGILREEQLSNLKQEHEKNIKRLEQEVQAIRSKVEKNHEILIELKYAWLNHEKTMGAEKK